MIKSSDLGRRAKVLRITTVTFSIATLLKGQIKYLNDRGLNVKMVASPDQFTQVAIMNEQADYIPVNMSRKFSLLSDMKSVFALFKLFQNEKPDIIHVNTAKAGLLAMTAGYFSNVKIRIYSVGGFKFQSASYGPLQRRFMILIERIIYLFSTHVWPNNPTLYSEILDRNLCHPIKVKLLGNGGTNGVDLDYFSTDVQSVNDLTNFKKKIDRTDGEFVLLFVGRLCKDKGIEELVTVFELLQGKGYQIKLILVGPIEYYDDPLSDSTVDMIRQNVKIIHVDWSEDIAEYMYLSDLFVFPSHREGLPNVVMQAGAMKLPVLCSDIMGNVDLVDDGVSGITFQKGENHDLQRKLELVLQGKYDLISLSNKLHDKIVALYDRKVVHKNIYNEYLQLLGTTGNE